MEAIMTKLTPPDDASNVPAQRREITPDYIPAEDVGKGPQPEARGIPILDVAQNTSPVLDPSASEYNSEVEASDIYCKDLLLRWDGKEGLLAIPIWSRRGWSEWLPARQGFQGWHDRKPDDAVTHIDTGSSGKPKTTIVRSSSGNLLQETVEIILVSNSMLFRLPCWSTRLTFSRKWQTYQGQFRHPNGGILPAFSRAYQIFTKPDSNLQGRWYSLQFRDCGFVNRETYEEARALYEFVKQGLTNETLGPAT
jgi:hypothetical protein